MLGKAEVSRKRERPGIRWINSIKEVDRHESMGAEQGCGRQDIVDIPLS